MSEVKRYDGKLGHNPDGGYVSHEDYAEEKRRADQNAQYLETLTGRMLDAEQERDALRQQLTATTNSLTNAQEALKSAGIEADTVQAGVMELVSKLVEMQNRATQSEAEAEKNLAGAHAWEKHARRATAERDALVAENALMQADYRDIPEMRRIGAPLTPATDACLNAARAEGVDIAVNDLKELAKRSLQEAPNASEHTHAAALYLMTLAAQLRTGNAGKDGV